MKTPETYQAKIVRVGFEPSPQLTEAVDRFTDDRRRGEKLFQSTTYRVVDFDNEEIRAEYEQSIDDAEKGLRSLGRHALLLADGVGIQELEYDLRFFFNVAEPEMLAEAVGMMRHIDGEAVEPKFNGVFIDLAKTALASRTREEFKSAALNLRLNLIDPESSRGLVVQRPRLVVREGRMQRPGPRRDIIAA